MKRCKTCRYYGKNESLFEDQGYCRKNPPVFLDQYIRGQWPVAADDDWCGEWKELVWEVTKGPSKNPEPAQVKR